MPAELSLEENRSLLLNMTNFGGEYQEDDCAETDELSKISQCIFIILSSLCGISAIGGNMALLVAFYRNVTVHGRINNYFIVSLAVADFLIGLLMTPLYICYAVYFEPYWLIKLEGFLWIATVTATTHSLSAVSVDRLISVLHPLRYNQIMTDKICRFAVLLIWFGALIFGIPRLVLNDFQKLEKLWIACSIATVAIPMFIMCFSYGKIFAIVKKQNRHKENSSTSRKYLGNAKAAVTIGIIVCLFVITFLPSAVVYFMLLFEDDICKEYELNDVWVWVALVSFMHSSVNPWVYGLRYRELRNVLKAMFKMK